MYAGLGITSFVAGWIFFFCFYKGRKWSKEAVMLKAVRVNTNADASIDQGKHADDGKHV